MAVRMGTRLQFSLTLPPELTTQQVPPLLLQPLVENSIQHGLEPKVEGGSVTVSAHRDGKLLCLEVLDSGLGLDRLATADASQGFGLSQVRERLHTLYGAAGTINLVAAHAGGTCARVTFPYKP